MWVPDWLLKLAGRKVADKLELQEDSKMESKPWWKSQTIWSAVVAGVIGVYNTVAPLKGLPPVPEWVYTLLGAIGIHGRVTADAKIG